MGIMNWISGGRARGGSFDRRPNSDDDRPGSGGLSPAHGNHAIDSARVLAPTHPAAITPTNPGNFSTVRSAAIVPSPHYFTAAEAATIRKAAIQRRQQVTSTKSAYKGLKSLEKSDAIVHTEHRRYETAVAKSELKKKQADVAHAKALHRMRPAYARMSTSLELAGERAAAQIAANTAAQMARHEQIQSRLAGVR